MTKQSESHGGSSILWWTAIRAFLIGSGVNAAFFAFGYCSGRLSWWFVVLPAVWTIAGASNFFTAVARAKRGQRRAS